MSKVLCNVGTFLPAIIRTELALTFNDAIKKTTDSAIWCSTLHLQVGRYCISEYCLVFQLPKHTEQFYFWWQNGRYCVELVAEKRNVKMKIKHQTYNIRCTEVFACSHPCHDGTHFQYFRNSYSFHHQGRTWVATNISYSGITHHTNPL